MVYWSHPSPGLQRTAARQERPLVFHSQNTRRPKYRRIYLERSSRFVLQFHVSPRNNWDSIKMSLSSFVVFGDNLSRWMPHFRPGLKRGGPTLYSLDVSNVHCTSLDSSVKVARNQIDIVLKLILIKVF